MSLTYAQGVAYPAGEREPWQETVAMVARCMLRQDPEIRSEFFRDTVSWERITYTCSDEYLRPSDQGREDVDERLP